MQHSAHVHGNKATNQSMLVVKIILVLIPKPVVRGSTVKHFYSIV